MEMDASDSEFLNEEYLDRYVAFLDILGFTECTEKCLTDPELFLRMRESLVLLKAYQLSFTDLPHFGACG